MRARVRDRMAEESRRGKGNTDRKQKLPFSAMGKTLFLVIEPMVSFASYPFHSLSSIHTCPRESYCVDPVHIVTTNIQHIKQINK